jgi:hypothetical protein
MQGCRVGVGWKEEFAEGWTKNLVLRTTTAKQAMYSHFSLPLLSKIFNSTFFAIFAAPIQFVFSCILY